MIEINADTDQKQHIEIKGVRYLRLTAEEVKNLPVQTVVEVIKIKNGKIIGEPEQFARGLRYRRPVLYRLPSQDTYVNIGSFADRYYLFRDQG